ncbi:peptidoglycan-recognition protein LC isoform X1 [Nomia melanderi]|uniref:peptidoglycan-recognition protein LC isoform X1 n=2 Tax=Nomia melanderi TaxID=2448451 RepID=UPI003FCECABC
MCTGMVTLVQQHQQSAPEENRYQKDQDQASCNIVIECDEAEDCNDEIVQSPKDITAVIPRASSLASSSTQCSEIENYDEEEEETDTDEGDWIPDLSVPAVLQHHQQVTTADGNLVLPNADTSNFGDVRVKNSTNVHLGNKTFYKGPVTIKQFVYTNPIPVQENEFVTRDTNRVSKCDTFDSTNATGITPTFSQKDWWNFTWNDRDTIIDLDETEDTQQRYKKCLTKVLNWLWSWRCAAFTCMIALILVIVVTIACVYFTRDTIPPEAVIPQVPDSRLNGSIVKNVRFIERSEWGAQPPSEPLKKMKLPVPYVIISHTATELCLSQSECTFHVRFAQTFHIESRKWSDIAYNFLVGGDGYAYVGRSWDYMGAHSFGFNNISIGISFIGTFNSVIPNASQLHAAQQLIKVGVEAGKIAPNYKLLGHRQISATLSPGDALYKVIQTWPHWSPSP